MSSDDTPNERMGHFDNDFFISRVFPSKSYIVRTRFGLPGFFVFFSYLKLKI